jgi:hypothetical protein
MLQPLPPFLVTHHFWGSPLASSGGHVPITYLAFHSLLHLVTWLSSVTLHTLNHLSQGSHLGPPKTQLGGLKAPEAPLLCFGGTPYV